MHYRLVGVLRRRAPPAQHGVELVGERARLRAIGGELGLALLERA